MKIRCRTVEKSTDVARFDSTYHIGARRPVQRVASISEYYCMTTSRVVPRSVYLGTLTIGGELQDNSTRYKLKQK